MGDRTVIHSDKMISSSVLHFVQRRECVAEPGEVYGDQPGLPRGACATIARAVVRVCHFYLATLWHLTVLALLIRH